MTMKWIAAVFLGCIGIYIASLLRKWIVEVKAANKSYRAARMALAAMEGDTDAVRQFLKRGVNVNARDVFGKTALMCTAGGGVFRS